MARAEGQWMPLYVADYLADTQHLTTAQHGAYLLLLFAYWRRGSSLPDDNAALGQIARCTPKEWKAMRPTIAQLFDIASGVWWSKRLEQELSKAAANYKARAEAGAKGSQKRWQKNGKAIAELSPGQCQTDAPSPSPTPNGVTDANASVAPTPSNPKSKPRRARLENTWQPSPDDYRFARDANLTPSEIAADIIEFVAYWTGPEPAKPIKSDWSRTYQNHIRDHAPRIIARRPRTGRSGGNGQGTGGVVNAVARIKARLSGTDAVPEGWEPEDGNRFSDIPADDGAETNRGDEHNPQILDGDECERLHRATGGNETADGGQTGAGTRPGSPTEPLCQEASGLSGGRDPESFDDTAEPLEVVANMVGTERAPGPVFGSPAPAAPSDDEDGYPAEFPKDLRRLAKIYAH